MSLLGIALCLLLLICWVVNRWFGQKVQQSLAVAERLRPLSEQFSTSVTLDVVIPAYNEEVYLRECVEAVLKSLDQFSGTGKVWISKISNNHPKLVKLPKLQQYPIPWVSLQSHLIPLP